MNGQTDGRSDVSRGGGKFGTVDFDDGSGANVFPARVLDRRHQGTQTAYEIDLFGRKLEVLELGTAARHQVGVDTHVSLPPECCWAYRDSGPSSYEWPLTPNATAATFPPSSRRW